MSSAVTLLVFGFMMGLRHATDADHVLAVSTIATRQRSTSGAALVGALWGLGHTATLLLVGGAIAGFGLVVPHGLELLLELGVAALLVLLGVMSFRSAPASVAPSLKPRAEPAPPTTESHLFRWRPLAVGVVHGLAGSAAVALLVLTTVRSAGWAVLYIGIFGVGTVAGMMLLTTVMALPLARLARQHPGFPRQLARWTGLASIALGVALAYQIGVVDGLFLGTASWSPG